MSRYLVNLKKGSDYLVPNVIGGIDTENVLYSLSSSEFADLSYTATQNCFLIFRGRVGASTGARIDDVVVIPGTDQNIDATLCLPLLTGQVFKAYAYISGSSAPWRLKVFGLKY